MRAALATGLLVIGFLVSPSAFALNPEVGKILRGKYIASGHASLAGVRVQYQPSTVNVSSRGRIKGRITKIVRSQGRILSMKRYRLKGLVIRLRTRGQTFEAPARISISDGARIFGAFQGLSTPGQRLSRYFRGTINGSSNGAFVLRSR
jgi:hypothetical protein